MTYPTATQLIVSGSTFKWRLAQGIIQLLLTRCIFTLFPVAPLYDDNWYGRCSYEHIGCKFALRNKPPHLLQRGVSLALNSPIWIHVEALLVLLRQVISNVRARLCKRSIR